MPAPSSFTVSTISPSSFSTATSILCPSAECLMALSIRFQASCLSSVSSPITAASSHVDRPRPMDFCPARTAASVHTLETSSQKSSRLNFVSAASAFARVRKRSFCTSDERRFRFPRDDSSMVRASAGSACMADSIWSCSAVRGVRSSWEARAAKSFISMKESSSLESMLLRISACWSISSPTPRTGRRSCRRSSVMRAACCESLCIGFSPARASSQPPTSDNMSIAGTNATRFSIRCSSSFASRLMLRAICIR